MAQIFSKWTLKLPLYAALAVIILSGSGVGFFWYYGSPQYTDVGYRPVQPVQYSHKLHAGDLGMDCRYCHTGVETSPHAGVPPTQTCMNCHKMVRPDTEKMAPVRESWASGVPIKWVRVHKTPDFAYFNHSSHINTGVGCESCHGNVRQMDVVQQVKPLSMSWCLDCHRAPEQFLRPRDQITAMNWQPSPNQLEFAAGQIKTKGLAPQEDCSTCHR